MHRKNIIRDKDQANGKLVIPHLHHLITYSKIHKAKLTSFKAGDTSSPMWRDPQKLLITDTPANSGNRGFNQDHWLIQLTDIPSNTLNNKKNTNYFQYTWKIYQHCPYVMNHKASFNTIQRLKFLKIVSTFSGRGEIKTTVNYKMIIRKIPGCLEMKQNGSKLSINGSRNDNANCNIFWNDNEYTMYQNLNASIFKKEKSAMLILGT